VFTLGGPDGLAKYSDNSGTGSNNQGKHVKHADSGAGNMGYDCVTCHTGYVMPQDSTKTIDIGFANWVKPAAGSAFYGGQNTAKYAGKNGTTVPNDGGLGDGSRQCSNIYCHSTVQASNGTGAPTYKNVVWNSGSLAMDCTSCH